MKSPPITDPQEARVLIALRVPWRVRDHLRILAERQGISVNQLIINALEVTYDGIAA